VETAEAAVIQDSGSTRRSDLVPTGSTLLNLALSGQSIGGFKLGTIVNVVGDSHAGKSFLAWHLLAECVYSKKFKDYELIYDDAEAALSIPIRSLFGKRVEDRVRMDIRSDYLEDFFVSIRKVLKKGKPFIYVLDSLDSLKAKEEDEKTDDLVGKRQIPDVPRILTQVLRRMNDQISDADSLLLIVSQTRKAIGVMFGDKLRRAGGDALRFHSHHELWLAVKGHERRKGRDVGVICRVKIKKNKLTGRQREISFPLYVDYGLDDIGSMVDWLVDEDFWVKEKGSRTVKTDYGNITREKTIKFIEDNNLESELRKMVEDKWNEIEDSIKTDRKRRYGDSD